MSSNENVLCRVFRAEEGQDSLDALMDYDTPYDVLDDVSDFISKLRETLRPAIEETKSVLSAINNQTKLIGSCPVELSEVQKALLEAGRILGVE